MIPGSWQQVSIAALVLFLIVGSLMLRPKKRGASRRKRGVLPAPWDGAIVRQPKFYASNWTASVGRAYRAMAGEQPDSSNGVPFRRRAS